MSKTIRDKLRDMLIERCIYSSDANKIIAQYVARKLAAQ